MNNLRNRLFSRNFFAGMRDNSQIIRTFAAIKTNDKEKI